MVSFRAASTALLTAAVATPSSTFVSGQSVLRGSARSLQTETLTQLVVGDPDLTTLEDAVVAAGLGDALGGDGNFTLLAPIDTAFGEVDGEFLEFLLEPEGLLFLKDILLTHVAEGRVLSTDLTNDGTITTLNGETLTVSIEDSIVSFEAAASTAEVDEVNILATNGVIHKIKSVLLPSFLTETLYSRISADPKYSTLVSLIDAAGLGDALKTSEEITLLAPINDAFDAVDTDTIEFLTDPANVETLTQVLLYHVLDDVEPSNVLEDEDTPKTLQGQTVDVAVSSSITFNTATVVESDILASNGVVHGIDAVLIPDLDDPAPEPAPAPAPTPTRRPACGGRKK